MDLRTRKRIAAMKRVQDAALDLFELQGVGQVSVEQIAARAGVGPATVYRYFGTKEGIVLWDEHDPVLLERLVEAMPGRSPLGAVREALRSGLAEIYDGDEAARILRRTRLTFAEPSVLAAMREQLAGLRAGVEAVLARHEVDDADVVAAVVVAALEVALHRWQVRGDDLAGHLDDVLNVVQRSQLAP